jgi:hypothetical protein
MKKILVSLILFLSFVAPTFAADLSKPYIPTRMEWLELTMESALTRFSNMMGINFGYRFESPKKFVMAVYVWDDESYNDVNLKVHLARGVVRDVLDKFPWAGDISVEVEAQASKR